ncbi:MAG TPA: DoxX family protein [Methylophilaceae bacterium]|nr:DoxX family protein [Methylophilaceae bacterium]
MNSFIHLAGRILLAIIFILAGIGKIKDPAGTIGYMQSVGLPGILLWPTIALEVLGGLAIVVGFQTRLVAFLLAGFTIVAAVMFHNNFGDQMQMIMFLKDLSIAGGLLLLVASGSTALSVDTKR